MLKRSWFFQNGIFFTILTFVLLIHLVLMAIRFQRSFQLSDSPYSQERPIRLRLTKADSLRQIVQSEDPTDNAETNNESRFLSDKDRFIERQSRARHVGTFESSSAGGNQKANKNIKLSDLGAFRHDHHPLREALKKREEQLAGKGQGERKVSSTNDYIQDIPLGDLTYLNTTEYKYYGFFYRIRQRLEQFWGRSIQEQAESFQQQGRRIASDSNLVTALEVTLNASGEIIAIKIRDTSGIKELDDAAVESFNEAGPFPNPPKGLVVNGKVKIEWGFVVNT